MLLFALSLLLAQGPKPRGVPVGADEGRKIIDKMRQAVRQAGPITVTQLMETRGLPSCVETLRAMQPKLATAQAGWVTKGEVRQEWEFHWTGSHKFVYNIPAKRVQDGEAEDEKLEYEWIGLESAFSDEDIYKNVQMPINAVFGGQNVYAINAIAGGQDVTLYVDRSTYLPAGYTMLLRDALMPSGKRMDVSAVSTYKDLVLHAPLLPGDFAWIAPKGATVTKPEAGPIIEIDQGPR
jgi:hypothetical protein